MYVSVESEVHRYHNVAQTKTASQSSSYGPNNPASLAVDDSPSTCARTDEERGALWMVDLGQTYVISHLHINTGWCSLKLYWFFFCHSIRVLISWLLSVPAPESSTQSVNCPVFTKYCNIICCTGIHLFIGMIFARENESALMLAHLFTSCTLMMCHTNHSLFTAYTVVIDYLFLFLTLSLTAQTIAPTMCI